MIAMETVIVTMEHVSVTLVGTELAAPLALVPTIAVILVTVTMELVIVMPVTQVLIARFELVLVSVRTMESV